MRLDVRGLGEEGPGGPRQRAGLFLQCPGDRRCLGESGCRRARVATRKGALERVAVVAEPVSEPTAVADSRCTL